MMRVICTATGATLMAGYAQAQPTPPAPNPGAVIESFAADFAHDPFNNRAGAFGVEVDDAWWTVTLTPGQAARVAPGRPTAPTLYFTMDAATLARIDAGTMNALTAMARAKQNDPTPMDIQFMEGAAPDVAWAIPLVFHFWTRGQPEIIPFHGDVTRLTHGANAGIFYYQPGFRSGFFRIDPGQHVNADPTERTNPFPSLILITRGRVNARIGGRDFVLNEGEAVLIQPEVSHEFLNEFDTPGEGVLLMFGDGA